MSIRVMSSFASDDSKSGHELLIETPENWPRTPAQRDLPDLHLQHKRIQSKVKQEKKQQDQINFVRLSLLYSDEKSWVGQEFVNKVVQCTSKTQAKSSIMPIKALEPQAQAPKAKKRSSGNLSGFCDANAIFFVEARNKNKRMIPKRHESSRIFHDGQLRRRGSVLDLIYEVPQIQQIEEQSSIDAEAGEKALNRKDTMSLKGTVSVESSIDIQMNETREIEVDSASGGGGFDQLLRTQSHEIRVNRDSISQGTCSDGSKDDKQVKKKNSDLSRLQRGEECYQVSKFTPALPQMIQNSAQRNMSVNVKRLSSSKGRRGISKKGSSPVQRLSLTMQRQQLKIDLSNPVTKLISRKLSHLDNSALPFTKRYSGELPRDLNSAPRKREEEGDGHSKPRKIRFERDLVDSLHSEYVSSDEELQIKAIQFFSKEDSTRINISKQKMRNWRDKLQSEIKTSGFKRQAATLDAPKVQVSSFSEQTTLQGLNGFASRRHLKDTEPKSACVVFPHQKRSSSGLESEESSNSSVSPCAKPTLLTNSLTAVATRKHRQSICLKPSTAYEVAMSARGITPYQSKRSVLRDFSRSGMSSNKKESDEKKFDVEALKEQLQKPSWETKEDAQAESRYNNFLLLQQLSKSLKKFYKNDFVQKETRVMMFRKASQFINLGLLNDSEQLGTDSDQASSVFELPESKSDDSSDYLEVTNDEPPADTGLGLQLQTMSLGSTVLSVSKDGASSGVPEPNSGLLKNKLSLMIGSNGSTNKLQNRKRSSSGDAFLIQDQLSNELSESFMSSAIESVQASEACSSSRPSSEIKETGLKVMPYSVKPRTKTKKDKKKRNKKSSRNADKSAPKSKESRKSNSSSSQCQKSANSVKPQINYQQPISLNKVQAFSIQLTEILQDDQESAQSSQRKSESPQNVREQQQRHQINLPRMQFKYQNIDFIKETESEANKRDQMSESEIQSSSVDYPSVGLAQKVIGHNNFLNHHSEVSFAVQGHDRTKLLNGKQFGSELMSQGKSFLSEQSNLESLSQNSQHEQQKGRRLPQKLFLQIGTGTQTTEQSKSSYRMLSNDTYGDQDCDGGEQSFIGSRLNKLGHCDPSIGSKSKPQLSSRTQVIAATGSQIDFSPQSSQHQSHKHTKGTRQRQNPPQLSIVDESLNDASPVTIKKRNLSQCEESPRPSPPRKKTGDREPESEGYQFIRPRPTFVLFHGEEEAKGPPNSAMLPDEIFAGPNFDSPKLQAVNKMSLLRKSRLSLTPSDNSPRSPSLSPVPHEGTETNFNSTLLATVQSHAKGSQPHSEEKKGQSPLTDEPHQSPGHQRWNSVNKVNLRIEAPPTQMIKSESHSLPANKLIQKQLLSPQARRAYEFDSDEDDKSTGPQKIKKDLNELKSLFIQSAKSGDTLIKDLAQAPTSPLSRTMAFQTEPNTSKNQFSKTQTDFSRNLNLNLNKCLNHLNQTRSLVSPSHMSFESNMDLGIFTESVENTSLHPALWSTTRSTSPAYRNAQRFSKKVLSRSLDKTKSLNKTSSYMTKQPVSATIARPASVSQTQKRPLGMGPSSFQRRPTAPTIACCQRNSSHSLISSSKRPHLAKRVPVAEQHSYRVESSSELTPPPDGSVHNDQDGASACRVTVQSEVCSNDNHIFYQNCYGTANPEISAGLHHNAHQAQGRHAQQMQRQPFQQQPILGSFYEDPMTQAPLPQAVPIQLPIYHAQQQQQQHQQQPIFRPNRLPQNNKRFD